MTDPTDALRLLPVECFVVRCEQAAADLEDRLLRYISSPQEHDLACPTLTPLVLLLLQCWACKTVGKGQ